MNSFNSDTVVALAALLEVAAIIGGGIFAIIRWGPQRVAVQAEAGASNAAAGLGAISTMKVVQSEQRALLAEMRTELADEKRVRIENDIEHVKRQRELETQLSETITRNDELAKEVVTLRGELTSMSAELEEERVARRKLSDENKVLRKRIGTLEGLLDKLGEKEANVKK